MKNINELGINLSKKQQVMYVAEVEIAKGIIACVKKFRTLNSLICFLSTNKMHQKFTIVAIINR